MNSDIILSSTQEETIKSTVGDSIDSFLIGLGSHNEGYAKYVFEQIILLKQSKISDKEKIGKWQKFEEEEISRKIPQLKSNLNDIACFAIGIDHIFTTQMSSKQLHYYQDLAAVNHEVKQYLSMSTINRLRDKIDLIEKKELLAQIEQSITELRAINTDVPNPSSSVITSSNLKNVSQQKQDPETSHSGDQRI